MVRDLAASKRELTSFSFFSVWEAALTRAAKAAWTWPRSLPVFPDVSGDQRFEVSHGCVLARLGILNLEANFVVFLKNKLMQDLLKLDQVLLVRSCF